VRKMSIGENYVGKLTPMRSNISRFSRGVWSHGPVNRLPVEVAALGISIRATMR